MKCTVCGKRFIGTGIDHKGMCARCRRGAAFQHPKAIAMAIRENVRRLHAKEISIEHFKATNARLWREADYGEMLLCGVNSEAARRVESVQRYLSTM